MKACIVAAVVSCAGSWAHACSDAGALGAFPLRWVETTMSDGKPLVLTLKYGVRDGTWAIRFEKTGEGLWAEGSGLLCQGPTGLQVRLPRDKLMLGPAAPWLLRVALGDGGTFSLRRDGSGALAVSTTGWSGSFRPAD